MAVRPFRLQGIQDRLLVAEGLQVEEREGDCRAPLPLAASSASRTTMTCSASSGLKATNSSLAQ